MELEKQQTENIKNTDKCYTALKCIPIYYIYFQHLHCKCVNWSRQSYRLPIVILYYIKDIAILF